MDVLAELVKQISANDSIIIGVSGGPDSLCLLHGLVSIRRGMNLKLYVGHLDHQLRETSYQDAEYVEQICSDWGVPCIVKKVDVNHLALQRKRGVEEAGRQARYDFFIELAKYIGANKIALGHNADDQAETVLMHILRGAGLDGLSGIAGKRVVDDLTIIRPLIAVPRSEIEAYCHEHRLEPRIDESNRDTCYYRNLIRHDIFPYLEKKAPGIRLHARQLANLAASDLELLESILSDVWPGLVQEQTNKQLTLDLFAWLALPTALRRRALRKAYSILRGSLQDLGYVHVENAIRLAETGHTGGSIDLPGKVLLEKSYDSIVFKAPNLDDSESTADLPLLTGSTRVPLIVPGITRLPDSDWVVEASIRPANEVSRSVIFGNTDRWCVFMDCDGTGERELYLRSRIPAEKFQPFGMKGKRMLVSDFMINEQIPSQLRDRIPILAGRDNSIFWIAGWRMDNRCRITEKSSHVLIVRFSRFSN